MARVGDALLAADRPADAEVAFAEVAAGWRAAEPADDGRRAAAVAAAGTALLAHGRYSAAEPHLRERLALRLKIRPRGWEAYDARAQLGECLTGLGRYAEAEPLLLAGFADLRGQAVVLSAVQVPVVALAADRLIALYAAWGKPAAAARWRAERAKYPPESAPLPRPVATQVRPDADEPPEGR